jgi:hypothetical protein
MAQAPPWTTNTGSCLKAIGPLRNSEQERNRTTEFTIGSGGVPLVLSPVMAQPWAFLSFAIIGTQLTAADLQA